MKQKRKEKIYIQYSTILLPLPSRALAAAATSVDESFLALQFASLDALRDAVGQATAEHEKFPSSEYDRRVRPQSRLTFAGHPEWRRSS